MNRDQISEKRAIEKRMDAFVDCNKGKGTPEEQAQFLKDYALETVDDLVSALYQWRLAEIRAAKARGEVDEDDYPVDDDKEAVWYLARSIGELLRGHRHDMLNTMKFATEMLTRTSCNIDADDEKWLSEHGMCPPE